CVRDQSNYDSW
nr:immunoglobulin heavy chain junction region [Macaca mulatta]MOX01796.1 immunoglobulin heavy chain junction region [Macaca mulatta]MOX01925.1 immunoglobulin heavy chain junction region [Macaca mulatta]MOX06143.1 immunoglobulin heavy chain junction region [Macaca mulatta]MOX06201.1 immunoglobulin heavy chain junction region [Macaca mulatta]